MAARPVGPAEAPDLYAMVAELASTAGQPMPCLYLSPIPQPNAFATGRDPRHAAVCVTAGILEILTPRELRAVLGHELSHVYNRDILISSVAAALAGIVTFLANLAWFLPLGSSAEDDAPNPLTALLMLVLGPLAAGLIQLAISRNREYTADADGAYLSADPLALASALDKIDRVARRLPLPADGPHASISHLMITNPLSGHWLSALFRTHPQSPTASAAWSRCPVTPPADRRSQPRGPRTHRPPATGHRPPEKICGGWGRHSSADVCNLLLVPGETMSSRRGR